MFASNPLTQAPADLPLIVEFWGTTVKAKVEVRSSVENSQLVPLEMFKQCERCKTYKGVKAERTP